jgi:hypothetical protein
MSSKQKKYYNDVKRSFLLSFFDDTEKYTEQNVNGFWLIKQWNGNDKRWQVAIYSEESYRKYKAAASGELYEKSEYGQHVSRFKYLTGDY